MVATVPDWGPGNPALSPSLPQTLLGDLGPYTPAHSQPNVPRRIVVGIKERRGE